MDPECTTLRKWNESVSEGWIPCCFIYMWNLRNKNKLINTDTFCFLCVNNSLEHHLEIICRKWWFYSVVGWIENTQRYSTLIPGPYFTYLENGIFADGIKLRIWKEIFLCYPGGPYVQLLASVWERGRRRFDPAEEKAEIGVMWPQARECS